jgi:hypothetical protein
MSLMQYKFYVSLWYRRAPKNIKEVIQYFFGLSVVSILRVAFVLYRNTQALCHALPGPCIPRGFSSLFRTHGYFWPYSHSHIHLHLSRPFSLSAVFVARIGLCPETGTSRRRTTPITPLVLYLSQSQHTSVVRVPD